MIPKQGWPFFQDFLFPLNTILCMYIKILALFHLQIILENCSYLIWFDCKLKKTSVCLQQPFGLMHFFPDKEMNTKGLWHPWHCKWQPYSKPYYFKHFCDGITEVSKECIIFFTFFPRQKFPFYHILAYKYEKMQICCEHETSKMVKIGDFSFF